MGMAGADKGKKCQCVGSGADKFTDATGCLHAGRTLQKGISRYSASVFGLVQMICRVATVRL